MGRTWQQRKQERQEKRERGDFSDLVDRHVEDLVDRLVSTWELFNRMVFDGDTIQGIAKEYGVSRTRFTEVLKKNYPHLDFVLFRRIYQFSQLYRRLKENPEISYTKDNVGDLVGSPGTFYDKVIKKAFGTSWQAMKERAQNSPSPEDLTKVKEILDLLRQGLEANEIAEEMGIGIGEIVMCLIDYKDLMMARIESDSMDWGDYDDGEDGEED